MKKDYKEILDQVIPARSSLDMAFESTLLKVHFNLPYAEYAKHVGISAKTLAKYRGLHAAENAKRLITKREEDIDE